MSFFFDIETLLQPISADAPSGVSLLHDPAIEAIKAARREDDPSLPAGVWQTELKVADWTEVETRCIGVLTGSSKDLMVAAWLAEAWLHRYGWDSLPSGLRLIEVLCERFWATLHPRARDGDWGFRAAPLVWIASQFPDLLAGRISLDETGKRDGVTLRNWKSAQQAQLAITDRKDVPVARREEATRVVTTMTATAQGMASSDLLDHVAAINEAREVLIRLEVLLSSFLGGDALTFGVLISTLDHALILIKEWIGMKPALSAPANDNLVQSAVPTSSGHHENEPQNSDGAFRHQMASRAAAYRQLAAIGEFLMEYEPHSPVPYMIQKALEWGAKPLPELLRQLTDEARGTELGIALGILPSDK